MKKSDSQSLPPRATSAESFVDETLLLEQDPVWDLIAQSPAPQAGPFFSRNVIQQIQLEQAQPTLLTHLGQLLRSPRLALPALAVLALVAFIFLRSPHQAETLTLTSNSIGDYVDQEILLAAADDPELLSDEDLIAILF